MKYRNRLNVVTLTGGIVFFIIAIMAGIFLSRTIASLLICLVGGALFPLALIYSTIGRTPKEIYIAGREMTLHSYIGRVRKVSIRDIEYLVIHPPDPPQWWKKYLIGGYAKIKNGRTFVFTREIGYAIREAYHEEMGYYPPEKPGAVPWR